MCEGAGQTLELDSNAIFPDPSLSIRAGAIAPWSSPAYQSHLDQLIAVAPKLGIPLDIPIENQSASQIERLIEGSADVQFEGLKAFFRSLESRTHRLKHRLFVSRFRRLLACPACHGARLRPEALAVKVEGSNIAGLSALIRPRSESFASEKRVARSPARFRRLAAPDR